MTLTTDLPLNPEYAIRASLEILHAQGESVDAGHWQGFVTDGKPDLYTREIINLNFTCAIPATQADVQAQCQANMPWAEEEFNERVGREPRNPHNSLPLWPWWHDQIETPFTHTYSERFWPKRANRNYADPWRPLNPARGIRYEYGDLDDMLDLLRRHPHTRQATFPIFFPEDTGAVHRGRIPCTLHYHFLLRANKLHMWYPIRSCDAVRHFRDDLYMAMRLNQWVIEELRNGDNDYADQLLWERVVPGTLCFTAYSFHVHKGDLHLLAEELA